MSKNAKNKIWNIQKHRNRSGELIGEFVNYDPTHPKSWQFILDDNLDIIGRLWSDDPEHPNSWVYEYDQNGIPTHRKYGDGRIEKV